jgi:hypothetical protein
MQLTNVDQCSLARCQESLNNQDQFEDISHLSEARGLNQNQKALRWSHAAVARRSRPH